MRTPASTVATLLLFIALSCKKDNESFPLDPPSAYHKKSVATSAPFRLFAKSGEINNASILNRYKSDDNSSILTLQGQLFPNKALMDTIRVQQGGDMAVYDNYQYYTYSGSHKGNNITLTGKDTIKAMSYYEVFTHTIPYAIAFYKPLVFSETLVTSTRGLYGFEYTTMKQYYLEAEQNAVRAPWVVGVIHNANGSILSLMVQNKIDINFHKMLAAGDTVAIQEYVVVYAK